MIQRQTLGTARVRPRVTRFAAVMRIQRWLSEPVRTSLGLRRAEEMQADGAMVPKGKTKRLGLIAMRSQAGTGRFFGGNIGRLGRTPHGPAPRHRHGQKLIIAPEGCPTRGLDTESACRAWRSRLYRQRVVNEPDTEVEAIPSVEIRRAVESYRHQRLSAPDCR